MSILKVDTILKRTGTGTITLGQSGDTISIPSGTTLAVTGTATGVGGTNTPRFLAYKASGYQGYGTSTTVKIIFDTEEHDSDSAYDTSNYRFTVPSGEAGVYVFGWRVGVQDVGATQKATINGYKNGTGGTLLSSVPVKNYSASTSNISGVGTFVATLAVSDYVEIYVTTPSTSGSGLAGLANQYFYGYKLI